MGVGGGGGLGLAETDVEVVVVEAVPATTFVCFFPGHGALVETVQNGLANQAILVEFFHGCGDHWANLSIDTNDAYSVGFEEFGDKEGRAIGFEDVGCFGAVVLILSICVMIADGPQVVVGLIDLVVGDVDVITVDMCILWVSESPTCICGGATILHTHIAEPEGGCIGVDTIDGGSRIFNVDHGAAFGPTVSVAVCDVVARAVGW